MNINDLVLIPDNDNIYLREIVNDYIYVPNKDNNHEGYPHQRNIEILDVPISCSTLSDALKKSLRNPSTIVNLDKHYDIIKQISTQTPINKVVIKNNSYEKNKGIFLKYTFH